MKQAMTGGFTIIELLLATTIFSIVMLAALVGFLQTGHLFYKGVSVTQTQATAKQIMDNVTSSIADTSASRISTTNPPSGGYSYYCVGNVRYTYNLNTMVDLSATHNWSAGANYGLLRDNVSGCAAPCVASCSAPFNNAVEMLGDRMRLSAFTIPAPMGSLYSISLIVAYGDSSSLDTSTNPPSCTGNSQKQQFCAVSNLSTSVFAQF